MKNRNISIIYFFSVIVIFIIVMTVLSNIETIYMPNNDKYFKNVGTKVENSLNQLLVEQDKTNQLIKEISNSKQYSIDNPYILVNPYKINPLSAMVIFYTEQDESVELFINDLLMTTFASSKVHVIPIYGLYANTNNFVMLKTESGASNTIKITTEDYNSNNENFDFKKLITNKKNCFVLGEFNTNKNYLRGFDHNGNLVYFLSLDYISSIKFNNKNLVITYNQKNSYKNLKKDLLLEIDLLGRILSVKQNRDITYSSNLEIKDLEYYGYEENLYEEQTENYIITNRTKELKLNLISLSDTKDLEISLDNAKIYPRKYNISINGDIINTNIENYGDKNLCIILVSKYSNVSYIYYLRYNGGNFDNSFSFTNKGEYSLFLKSNDKYYSLNTVIEIK